MYVCVEKEREKKRGEGKGERGIRESGAKEWGEKGERLASVRGRERG